MNGIGLHLKYKSEVIIHLKITKIVHIILVYKRMDRDWIYSSHISVEYQKGVEKFIQFVQRHKGRSDDEVKLRCPCVNCWNARKLNATEMKENLIYDAFLPSYTIWTWHDELIDFQIVSQTENVLDSTVEDRREV